MKPTNIFLATLQFLGCQLLVGMVLYSLLYPITDASGLKHFTNLASILAGCVLYGYWIERKNPDFLDKLFIKKLCYMSTLIIGAFVTLIFVRAVYLDSLNSIKFFDKATISWTVLMVGFLLFVYYYFAKRSLHKGINIRKNQINNIS